MQIRNVRIDGKANHLCQTPSCDDVAGVDESVQMSSGFFYRLPHLVVTVEIKDIGYEVEGILVVCDFSVEPREVESICKVVLVDFAEVLVASRRDELLRSLVSLRCYMIHGVLGTGTHSVCQQQMDKNEGRGGMVVCAESHTQSRQ